MRDGTSSLTYRGLRLPLAFRCDFTLSCMSHIRLRIYRHSCQKHSSDIQYCNVNVEAALPVEPVYVYIEVIGPDSFATSCHPSAVWQRLQLDGALKLLYERNLSIFDLQKLLVESRNVPGYSQHRSRLPLNEVAYFPESSLLPVSLPILDSISQQDRSIKLQRQGQGTIKPFLISTNNTQLSCRRRRMYLQYTKRLLYVEDPSATRSPS